MGLFDFLKKNKETAPAVEKHDVKVEEDDVVMPIELFPDISTVFNGDPEKNTSVFFPVCTIDLGLINSDWKNQKIHLIQFHEDPYNSETAKYFNDYCKDNMISFSIESEKYTFNTEFGYFDLTDDWREYYEETKLAYQKSKNDFVENGATFNLETIKIGGEPEWWQSDATPLDPTGKPMTFITEVETYGFCPDSCDKKIFLFYSHEHKLAVELYQIT